MSRWDKQVPEGYWAEVAVYQFGVYLDQDRGSSLVEPGPGTHQPAASDSYPGGELAVAGQLLGGGAQTVVVVEAFYCFYHQAPKPNWGTFSLPSLPRKT